MFFPRILPKGLLKHCDLAYMLDPNRLQIMQENDILLSSEDYANEKVLILSFKYKPHTGTYILQPGSYKFVIAAAASNAKPVRKTIEVNFLDWYQEEEEMLKDGINFKII
jgi:hypothetical protein